MGRIAKRTMAVVLVAGSAVSAAAAQPPVGTRAEDPLARALARELIKMLPADHREAILAAEAAASIRERSSDQSASGDDVAAGAALLAGGSPAYERLSAFVSASEFVLLERRDIELLLGVLDDLDQHRELPALCLAPEANPALIEALDDIYALAPAFQQTNRWSGTALTPSSTTQGTPAVITYSFVPDGTQIPSTSSFEGGPSDLQAWLDGIYGSRDVWQPLFDDTFERWSELIGTEYVFEPNDDGVTIGTAAGVAGVRGDVRIAAQRLDGNGNVLAFNFFPNNGDMVFDSGDSFYSSNAVGTSVGLRNVISHEHGHGLGMLHVCPRDQTKLMEPSISFRFDGPQLDDVLNGQRHYGDVNEPNDGIGSATPVAPIVEGSERLIEMVSIDDNSDTDFYSVTIDERVNLVVEVAPAAAAFRQGPQTSACNTGALTDYNAIHDLSVVVLDASGATVGSANDEFRGGTERGRFTLDPGAYTVVVGGEPAVNSIQLYDLRLSGEDPDFFPGELVLGDLPELVESGTVLDVSFTVELGTETLLAPPRVRYRFGPEASFESIEATGAGPAFSVSLPPVTCDSEPEVLVEVDLSESGTLRAELGRGTVLVGEPPVLADSGDVSLGWLVTGDSASAATGRWERGVPAGLGDRGDPTEDNGRLGGAGGAWLTGNGAGNTDVDDGETILLSPIFDGTRGDGTVSYARWYTNAAGQSPNQDVFLVQISNDGGGSWTELERVGPIVLIEAWVDVTFDIASFITPTDSMRLRFIASDLGEGSIVEAGIDDFEVGGEPCIDPAGPCSPADITPTEGAFGQIDGNDVAAFVQAFLAGDPIADLAPTNGSFGQVDGNDIAAFVQAFVAGCP